ncbi:unnamed protein product, partial [Amoebophrya sp. A120]|eukprot:GSA120T00024169001.1
MRSICIDYLYIERAWMVRELKHGPFSCHPAAPPLVSGCRIAVRKRSHIVRPVAVSGRPAAARLGRRHAPLTEQLAAAAYILNVNRRGMRRDWKPATLALWQVRGGCDRDSQPPPISHGPPAAPM